MRMRLKDTIHFQWYKHLFILFILFCCIRGSIGLTGANLEELVQNSNQATLFLSRFLTPEFSYLPKLVKPLIKTL